MRKITQVVLTSLVFIGYTLIATDDAKAELLTGNWQPSTNLDSPISGHASLSFGNKVYIINGSSFINSTHPDTWESTSLIDGQLVPWSSISQLSQPLIGLKAVRTSNNFAYLAGGLIDESAGYSSVNTFLYANYLNSLLSPWNTTTTPLLEQVSEGGFVYLNNRLYYLGGYEIHGFGSAVIPHVETTYTDLNIDGTLADWKYTTPLNNINQPVYFIGAVETGKKILTIGGKVNESNRFSRAVFQSEVNPLTGELGAWEETYPLPDNNGEYTGYNSMGVTRAGDYIIAIGGTAWPTGGGGGVNSNKVYFTKIASDGGIEPWQTSQFDLPIVSSGGAVQFVNGYLYYMGGYSTQLGGYHNKVYFSNLNIPVSTPTPTPTLTPTPQPGVNLNVPDIKQYSLPWGPLTYDHSKSVPPTISRWGCALTSAAMILQYHGSTLTPEGLNDWLKQNNGYTGNGIVKWASISTFSMQDTNTANLEFTYPAYSETLLKTELGNNRPVFIKLENVPYGGNHFITAKGFNNSDIFINDPAKTTNPTLSDANSYWGGNVSIGKFTPSNTDLSYLTLFFNDGITLKVFDPNNFEIGQENYHKEYPILDPNNSNSVPEGEVYNSFYLPKPETGVYRVELSGNTNYELDTTVYDTMGNSVVTLANGDVDLGQTKTFYIQFSKEGESLVLDESIVDLIDLLAIYDKSNIFKRGVYNHIKNSILNINGHILTGENNVSLALIDLLKKYIDENKNKQLATDFYNRLNDKLQTLYASTTLNSYLASI